LEYDRGRMVVLCGPILCWRVGRMVRRVVECEGGRPGLGSRRRV
jgi:hypothetical protein